MNEMYQARASEYAKAIKNNIYNSLFDRPSLLGLLEKEEFDFCLDMGCGPGAYIEELKKRCSNIVAIDLSKEFIEIVSNEHPDVKAYTSDISEGLGREEDNKFDLVISPLTIHYIKDLKALFNEVRRVLVTGGIFCFSTHHIVSDYNGSKSGNYFEREKLTQMWNTLGDKTEVSFYRRPLSETLNALFDAGFVVEGFSEGSPSPKVREISEEQYQRLKTKPQFMFVRAKLAPDSDPC